MGIKITIAVALIIIAVLITVLGWLFIEIPANVKYGNAFGADFVMLTGGASTLTGPDSMQDYLLRIWNNMNTTFNTANFAHIYSNPWPWGQTSDNTMAKQNEWFNSINQTIYQQQEWLNEVVSGKVSYTGGDPVIYALSQTRLELNSNGGADWVINGAWYLEFAPLAYYLALVLIIFWIVIIVVAFALVYLDVTSGTRALRM